MEKITLIAADFDSLNIPIHVPTPRGWRKDEWSDNNNGSSANDCPIARALIRAGVVTPHVCTDIISGVGVEIISNGNFSMYEVERCRLELLAGAPEAYIQIIQPC